MEILSCLSCESSEDSEDSDEDECARNKELLRKVRKLIDESNKLVASDKCGKIKLKKCLSSSSSGSSI